MSHTIDDRTAPHGRRPDENAGREAQPGRDLTTMLFQGRSFSGRERNCCFLNTGNQRFATLSFISGLDFPDDGRAVAVVDWDQDGDLDLWIANRNAPRLRLMDNRTPAGNHYVALRLVGNGRTTNRDAIGARVEVLCGGQRLLKTLRAGEGFLAQSSKELSFGLGKSDAIDAVVVHWPGGTVEHFSGLKVDTRYVLEQGSGRPVKPSAPRRVVNLQSSEQNVATASSSARIALLQPLPMLGGFYRTFAGEERQLELGKGRGLVVNLWASWCSPCRTELREFSERAKDLEAAGVDVLALSVDGLEEGAGGQEDTLAAAARIAAGLPFPAGRATPELIQLMQSMHDRLIPSHRQLPLPTSFLMDGSGRLVAMVKGRLTVTQLLDEMRLNATTCKDRAIHAALLPGRVIEHERVDEVAGQAQLLIRYRLAQDLQKSGRLDEAAIYYADVLTRDPSLAEAHNNLGTILAARGDFLRASTEFERALKSRPDYAEAQFNLGTVLEQQGQLNQAADAYRRAQKLQPAHVEAHFNLGNVLARQGIWAEAVTEYEATLRLRPEHFGARQNLAVAMRQLGRL